MEIGALSLAAWSRDESLWSVFGCFCPEWHFVVCLSNQIKSNQIKSNKSLLFVTYVSIKSVYFFDTHRFIFLGEKKKERKITLNMNTCIKYSLPPLSF